MLVQEDNKMHQVNATVNLGKTVKCGRCHAVVEAGGRVAKFRERALSYREASHAGMYPMRVWCAACANKPNSYGVSK